MNNPVSACANDRFERFWHIQGNVRADNLQSCQFCRRSSLRSKRQKSGSKLTRMVLVHVVASRPGSPGLSTFSSSPKSFISDKTGSGEDSEQCWEAIIPKKYLRHPMQLCGVG